MATYELILRCICLTAITVLLVSGVFLMLGMGFWYIWENIIFDREQRLESKR